MFGIISFFLNNNGQYSTDDGTLTAFFNIVILVMTACCVFASILTHKISLKKIKLMNNLSDKLKAYRAMFIKRFALLESPISFGIVVFFAYS